MRSLIVALMLAVTAWTLTNEGGLPAEAASPTTVRLSVSTTGAEANLEVITPAISGTGRFVIFRSYSTTLVPGGQAGQLDIYLRDRDTDDDGMLDESGAVSTIRASVNDDGNQVIGEHNWAPDITPDGRFLAFASDQFDLASTEEHCSWDLFNSSCPNVFVRDRDTDNDGIFDEPGAVKEHAC
jgi:Tol biopolymer transport system component